MTKPFILGKAKAPEFAADLMKQMDASMASLGKQVIIGQTEDEPHCVRVIKRLYTKAEEAFDAGDAEHGFKLMNAAMAGSLKLTEIHAKTALGLQLALDRADERKERMIAHANRDGNGARVVESEEGSKAVNAARQVLAGRMYAARSADFHTIPADTGETE